MGWLPKFFSKNTAQQVQPSADFSPNPTPTTMTQLVVEQTIMTAANWLVHFVNRSLEAKATAPVAPPESPSGEKADQVPVESPPDTVEILVARLGTLLEQAYDRNQATAALAASLEERLNAIEASLKQNQLQNQSQPPIQALVQAFSRLENRINQLEARINPIDPQAIDVSLQINQQMNHQLQQANQVLSQEVQALKPALAVLENRLVPIENFAEHGKAIINSLAQAQQDTETLESRIDHLEKLLAQFRLIPKLVEGNYRAIVRLQQHLQHSSELSSIGQRNGNGETANVVPIAKAR
ncbi:hypothetical protein [Leptolyngbya sp. ST-U4]|uniref:hypothetical protein n=3 Tax=unclassified Leptolyngbya TaxID=2650499 RepID=UPI00198731AC|nr:hypothetical protein [Cyanobacteria bacterium FACHB-502]